MGSEDRKMVSLGQGLRSLIASMDTDGKLAMARVIEVWNEVAGPEIAHHTFVSGLKEGILLVLVDSPVWAAQLNAMAEQLKERIWEETGQKTVSSIRFNVSRRVGLERHEDQTQRDSEQGYGGRKVTPEPLSAGELEVVRKSVAGIENETLRGAALRATVADLERKKAQEALNSAQGASSGLQGTKKAR